ncbi:hypothetical protein CVT25_012283 [Psilocybe cyanescens]|uniref:Uncharacterized protein n=1 Tax=Psilocybe cyanescens TaxID=93625 RepID=A0A409XHA5_PSICY|nr:hypothetical protein CVT25_012283 [Psilocybe cyanescens]
MDIIAGLEEVIGWKWNWAKGGPTIHTACRRPTTAYSTASTRWKTKYIPTLDHSGPSTAKNREDSRV